MPTRESGFLRDYRSVVAQFNGVAETAEPDASPEIKERLVQCLWYEQYFDTAALRTQDGRRLTLFSPGYWNESSGPDFRNAEMAFDDGPRLRGDVELHVNASDWRQHGHETDPAYRDVILHVVLTDNGGAPAATCEGRAIPQLALSVHLSADLAEIIASLEPEACPEKGVGREGPCCRSARALGRGARWLARFLDMAGDERMLLKAGRFADAMQTATPDDVAYAALMDCMGYSANREGFRTLCRRAPLRELRRRVAEDAPVPERRAAIQAILYGLSGFLTAPLSEAAQSDPETVRYVAALTATWNGLSEHWPAAPMAHKEWVRHRTRPTNHPIRRIAAISGFVAQHLHSGLCRALLASVEGVPAGGSEAQRCRQTLDRFATLFDEPPDPYWRRRAVFGPATLRSATRLIGPTRSAEMVVNAAVPMLLALSTASERARVEQRLHNLYRSLRPLADNAVTRDMKTRIFDTLDAAGRIVSTVRRQQGLIQIFHDFCETTDTTCETCGFLAAIEGRPA